MSRCRETIVINEDVLLCDRIEEHSTYNRHRGKQEILSDDGKHAEVTVEWD